MQSNEEESPFIDAVVAASRALASVVQRTLCEITDEVTLAQYRTLVVLALRGPQNLASLAKEIGVTPATATRMCDRLVAKELITRHSQDEDRRHIRLVVASKGHQLVSAVGERRRSEMDAIVRSLSLEDETILSQTLIRFAAAVGEVPEQDWSTGWEI
jgi:DNA-binding MarR family transcriptional regulator